MKNVLSLLFSFLVIAASAQDILPITKQEVLTKVQNNNYALMIAQQEIKAAQAGYDQTKASYLPTVQLSYTGIGTDNPLMAFGSKLNQQRITQSDFNPDYLNNPDVISNFYTKLDVQQPLLNLDAKYYRKAAAAKIQATEWQMARTREYLELAVEQGYIRLQLAYRAVEVIEQARNTALENRRVAENSLKQGFLQRSDLLAIEVRISELTMQLQQAKTNIANASNYLAVLMNDNEITLLKPLDSLTILSEEQPAIEVPASRADLRAMSFATEAYAQLHMANEKSFYPRLNAFASYELYDKTPFTDAGGFLIGLQASWNIFEGSKRYGKRRELEAVWQKSKIQERQYFSQAQLELNQANRQLEDLTYRLELTRLAVAQSKEALRIRTNRFTQGLEKTTDLLLAETQYSQKQMELYTAIADYNMALAQLQFLGKP